MSTTTQELQRIRGTIGPCVLAFLRGHGSFYAHELVDHVLGIYYASPESPLRALRNLRTLGYCDYYNQGDHNEIYVVKSVVSLADEPSTISWTANRSNEKHSKAEYRDALEALVKFIEPHTQTLARCQALLKAKALLN